MPTRNELWTMFDTLRDELGADRFLFELAESLDLKERAEHFEFVARMNRITL